MDKRPVPHCRAKDRTREPQKPDCRECHRAGGVLLLDLLPHLRYFNASGEAEVMKTQTIDVEGLADISGWGSAKAYRNALDRVESDTGSGIKPRTAKLGGRYAFAIVDVLDAALARPLIARGVTIAEAFEKVRPVVTQQFVKKKGCDADPLILMAQAEGRFISVLFRDEALDHVTVMDRPDIVYEGPEGSAARWNFDSGASALLFPLSDRVRMVLERAERRGLDLTRIEHGALS